jgi:hypothetical protein
MGYDVLLEKPISPSEEECREILALANKTGRVVAVCHVLRYAPYFIRLKEMIDSGAVGSDGRWAGSSSPQEDTTSTMATRAARMGERLPKKFTSWGL